MVAAAAEVDEAAAASGVGVAEEVVDEAAGFEVGVADAVDVVVVSADVGNHKLRELFASECSTCKIMNSSLTKSSAFTRVEIVS